ncbi:BQ5605_C047g12330 [Microbotryum silenes-dioicae]|uniref:BQ5605_C047g12330 protein n=1 Tax=Microbotryum silenes-dioicae TaxID=796604 RepID=A0A2X0PNS2_9BASI|nr:BQ5605_C047g12330 [Microbotryum silenes-dioicae]
MLHDCSGGKVSPVTLLPAPSDGSSFGTSGDSCNGSWEVVRVKIRVSKIARIAVANSAPTKKKTARNVPEEMKDFSPKEAVVVDLVIRR